MTADRTDTINALLVQAQEAHAVYEANELNGVYDQDWPRWYATYAVDHGVGQLLGRDFTADELESFLASSYRDFQRAEPQDEPWAAYTARRIAAEL
jgi:hypothetical protein